MGEALTPSGSVVGSVYQLSTMARFLPFSATLLIILLLLPFTLNAVPISRTMNLMDEGSLGDLKDLNIHSESVKESLEIMKSVTERMDLEVNDYPGSGANNRHTPRP